MPNFSGIWTVTQQMQARGASTWPATPGAPTIGTATAGSTLCASVTFTAPSCTGYPAGVTGYRVISTPGCFTATGASSPLVVTGLTLASSYTFKAQATNSTGYGPLSAASNSITASQPTCSTYTSIGTYSWVAPAGVTSVAVLLVGSGGTGAPYSTCGPSGGGGGGGGLTYKNSISVTPTTSYTVSIGPGTTRTYFNTSSFFAGAGTSTCCGTGGQGGNVTVAPTCGAIFASGGKGGNANCSIGAGGGGASGYVAGGSCTSAGRGGCYNNNTGKAPNGSCTGAAGGGGAGVSNTGGGGGGGVGLYGLGATGTAVAAGIGGTAGSGGTNGKNAGTSTPAAEGGLYGGGGGGSGSGVTYKPTGTSGAVRIVWAGGARGTPSFPSTNVGP